MKHTHPNILGNCLRSVCQALCFWFCCRCVCLAGWLFFFVDFVPARNILGCVCFPSAEEVLVWLCVFGFAVSVIVSMFEYMWVFVCDCVFVCIHACVRVCLSLYVCCCERVCVCVFHTARDWRQDSYITSNFFLFKKLLDLHNDYRQKWVLWTNT